MAFKNMGTIDGGTAVLGGANRTGMPTDRKSVV